jgi:hypothetical protein
LGSKANMVAVFLAIVLSSCVSLAQEKQLGVGIVLGSPTGFSVRYWKSLTIAYQGVLGASSGGVAIGGDYLLHSRPFSEPKLLFFYGPGVLLLSTNRRATGGVAVRGVFGVDYVFHPHPFDIAFEMGPIMFLLPAAGIGVNAAVAFRFYP